MDKRLVGRGIVGVALGLCLGANCVTPIPLPGSMAITTGNAAEEGFCQDWAAGAVFHPDEDCFRKTDCVLDCPQVCTDEAGNSVDSRDLVSPVMATAGNGRCIYDVPWTPLSGVQGHGGFWGHALIDVVPAIFGGLLPN